LLVREPVERAHRPPRSRSLLAEMPFEGFGARIELLALPETHDRRTGNAALAKRQRIVGRDQAGTVCRHRSNVVKRIGLEKLPNHRREQRPKVVRPRVSHPQKPQSRTASPPAHRTLARRGPRSSLGSRPPPRRTARPPLASL